MYKRILKYTVRPLIIIFFLLTIFTSCQCINNNTVNLLNYQYDQSGQIPEIIHTDGKSYPVRHFSISAISLSIAYNDFGDHDPNGMMYVLNENKDEVLSYAKQNPTVPYDLIEPLVIRANAGDVVVVDFYNELPTPASIHITGVETNVQKSDGAVVGFNINTTTKDHIRYVWYAKNEGTYLFHDMSDMGSSEEAKNIHGLFGVLAVESRGSMWTDPKTGEPLLSGCYADIHHPLKPDFREFVTIFHDEPEMKDINGENPVNHETHLQESTMPISYRSEPMRNRMLKDPGENTSMSSWMHGDPATAIMQTYLGDPVKIRLVHAGVKETHVFHMHNHQWLAEPNDINSNIIDSVSISPQDAKEIDLLFGAGSLTETIGDIIWHCHLYPHFNEGMWGLLRVNDRFDEGGRIFPDGSKTNPLVPLPDREPPLLPDALHPGYPLFLKGQFGEQALKPPFGIIGSEFREPTALEEANFVAGERGNLYAKAAPVNAPVKVFDITAIQMPLIYNNQGWNDPEGRLFVLSEDEADVIAGIKKPEPLIIRANAGDVVEIHLTNKLPPTIGGNAFQLLTETTEAGFHIHLVKFDTIAADGSANGWNYDASALYGDTLVETFYADSELKTIFFHDYLYANVHQQHGLFGALIIEPAGSTYHDIKTGEPLHSGTQAVIKAPGLPDFREFVLAVHDFALLFDKEGNPLNPPNVPGAPDDPGVMGINYKCEPLQFRKGDPAYAFSSFMHGDPVTPVLETYAGDPVRIRLFDGAHEEQHSFIMSGLRWHQESENILSPLVNQQTIGLSEAFNLYPDNNYKAGDYLYYFGAEDDLWLGLWGIFRAHDQTVPHLKPLDDREPLPNRITPLPHKTGNPPSKAILPDLPAGVTVRKAEISAIQKKIVYNKFGDHDPNGLLYVYDSQVSDVLNDKIAPEPLVLRVNSGEVIEVTLTNRFTQPLEQTFHPGVPVNTDYPPSERVSINPSLVLFDPMNSGGITVGYNPDQTAGPGDSITYRWYANLELGTCMLTDAGDIMNHRGHGLWGSLIVEPDGAVYLDAKTMKPLTDQNTVSAVIKTDDRQFREFVLFMQDGLGLYDIDGNLLPDAVDTAHGGSGMHDDHEEEGENEEEEEGVDFEDQGQKGFNYRSENFANRFKNNSNPLYSLSSVIHGDPSTPVLEASTGEDVCIRLLMPADKPRNNCFVLHGHTWQAQPDDPNSAEVWSQGAVSIGSVYNIKFTANPYPGDYVYRSGAFRWSVEQGMWGILRIHNNLQDQPIVIICVIFIILFTGTFICFLYITCKRRR
ncbi:MAG: multicopper oxidase domain-containing protein [Eubacteriales bacterium]